MTRKRLRDLVSKFSKIMNESVDRRTIVDLLLVPELAAM